MLSPDEGIDALAMANWEAFLDAGARRGDVVVVECLIRVCGKLSSSQIAIAAGFLERALKKWCPCCSVGVTMADIVAAKWGRAVLAVLQRGKELELRFSCLTLRMMCRVCILETLTCTDTVKQMLCFHMGAQKSIGIFETLQILDIDMQGRAGQQLT